MHRVVGVAYGHGMFSAARCDRTRSTHKIEVCALSGWPRFTPRLRWSDLDLDAGYLTVSHQIRQIGAYIEVGKPKSEASNRVIALDHNTVTVLRRYRDSCRSPVFGEPVGYLFLNGWGRPIRPDALTNLFRRLNDETRLPPIRLHGQLDVPRPRRRPRSSRAGCRTSNRDSAASPARPAQGRYPATGDRGQTAHHDRPHGCLRTTA
jgi:hypothetical protein